MLFFLTEEENLGPEEKKCLLVCENLQHLLQFFVMTVTLQAEPPRYSTVVPDSPVDDDEVSDLITFHVNLNRIIISSNSMTDFLMITLPRVLIWYPLNLRFVLKQNCVKNNKMKKIFSSIILSWFSAKPCRALLVLI